MPQARRVTSRITPEERAAIRAEVLGEVRDAMYHSPDVDQAVLDALDERIESYEPKPVSVEDVRNMDASAINAHWQQVSDAMAASGRTDHHTHDDGVTDSGPLTWEKLKQMPESEHLRRRQEIDRFLAHGGHA